MASLKRLLEQVHERSLWQILGSYAAGAWFVLQVIEVLLGTVGLPDWVAEITFGLLVAGLPIVLATAFVQRGLRGRPDHAATGLRRHLTWRRVAIGGVAAFALLGAGTTVFMVMRGLGIGPPGTLLARGLIQEGELIVFADLEDAVGDPRLVFTIRDGLRYQLDQSPAVGFVGPERLQLALRRMELADTTAITSQIAREIIRRHGFRAYLTGAVSAVGNRYLLTLQLVDRDGEVLLSEQVQADGEEDILHAVDRLADRFRERIGESLRTVRASPALPDATTRSLEALELYSEGGRESAHRRFEGAVRLLGQAVVVDSSFAEAYVALAHALRDLGRDRSRQVAAISRAFELRHRLPESRRLYVEGVYYGPIFRAEADRALESLRAAAVLGDIEALAYIAFVHRSRADYASALSAFEEALRADTLYARAHVGVVRMLWSLERHAAGDSALAVMERRLGDHPLTDYLRGVRPLVLRDWDAADSAAARAPADRWSLIDWSMDLYHGRLDRADRFLQLDPDAPGVSLNTVINNTRSAAYADLLGRRGDPEKWVRALDELVARIPPDVSFVDDEPANALNIARLYALLGAPERASVLLGEFDAATVDGFLGELAQYRDLVVSEIAVAEGRYDDAIRALRAAHVGHILDRPIDGLARAYDRAGMADSAIATAERFLATTYWQTTWTLLYPIWYERLGELYDARGDLENAARYYAMFIEAWSEADPDLQPRVSAARQRLEEILAERG